MKVGRGTVIFDEGFLRVIIVHYNYDVFVNNNDVVFVVLVRILSFSIGLFHPLRSLLTIIDHFIFSMQT